MPEERELTVTERAEADQQWAEVNRILDRMLSEIEEHNRALVSNGDTCEPWCVGSIAYDLASHQGEPIIAFILQAALVRLASSNTT